MDDARNDVSGECSGALDDSEKCSDKNDSVNTKDASTLMTVVKERSGRLPN